MKWDIVAAVVFGLFCILGGVMGYVKAQSAASLIAGGVSGLLLLLSAWGVSKNKIIGLVGVLILCVALIGRFLGTFLQTQKVMPDLITVILGTITILIVGFHWRKRAAK